MRSFSFVSFATLVAVVSSFQNHHHHPRQQILSKNHASTVLFFNPFDKFVKGMEAGYSGEDSAYEKTKARDAEKREAAKEVSAARRAKGYTKLEDVKEKSFAKSTYQEKNKQEGADDDDDSQSSGFKFPWDK